MWKWMLVLALIGAPAWADDTALKNEIARLQAENQEMRDAITGFSAQCVGVNPEDIWWPENLEGWARAFGGDVNAEKRRWFDCRNTYLRLVQPFALPENEIDWSKVENSQQ